MTEDGHLGQEVTWSATESAKTGIAKKRRINKKTTQYLKFIITLPRLFE